MGKRGESKPLYTPSKEEIRQAREEIQDGWSNKTRMKREGARDSWMLPTVTDNILGATEKFHDDYEDSTIIS